MLIINADYKKLLLKFYQKAKKVKTDGSRFV